MPQAIQVQHIFSLDFDLVVCCDAVCRKAILDLVNNVKNAMVSNYSCDFKVRIGINSGNVVAGTIRASKPRFQIFGWCASPNAAPLHE